jgi:hypothetical protein
MQAAEREIPSRSRSAGPRIASVVDGAAVLDRRRPLMVAIIEHRLSIFMIYANANLSAHEAALEKRHAGSSRVWGQPFMSENMLDTLEAALTCPPSERGPSFRK